MKRTTIIYWTTTIIIFLFDAVMPALTSNSQLAIDGIRHLGYPDYFRVMLTIFKITGGVILVLPVIPARFKEWAYAGFGINFIAAAVSHAVVDGINFQTFFPVIILGILVVSYITWHQLRSKNTQHESISHQTAGYSR